MAQMIVRNLDEDLKDEANATYFVAFASVSRDSGGGRA